MCPAAYLGLKWREERRLGSLSHLTLTHQGMRNTEHPSKFQLEV